MFVQRQVPVNLLRASRVFVFEPPPGVKANLLRTFSAVPAARMCKVSHNLYYFSRANNVMVHLKKIGPRMRLHFQSVSIVSILSYFCPVVVYFLL